MPAKAAYTPPTSDEAVQAKTGKTWPEWFAQLDADGAKKLSHRRLWPLCVASTALARGGSSK
jgi:hypothetical protein